MFQRTDWFFFSDGKWNLICQMNWLHFLRQRVSPDGLDKRLPGTVGVLSPVRRGDVQCLMWWTGHTPLNRERKKLTRGTWVRQDGDTSPSELFDNKHNIPYLLLFTTMNMQLTSLLWHAAWVFTERLDNFVSSKDFWALHWYYLKSWNFFLIREERLASMATVGSMKSAVLWTSRVPE